MKYLIIQTAFTGDVILATGIAEKLNTFIPGSEIDILVRKGNETLLDEHPFLKEILVWDKKKKYKDLLRILKKVRAKKYDQVINLHRFGSSGFITTFSNAKYRRGFNKNPFSFFFSKKFKHEIGTNMHETVRNHLLIKDLTDAAAAMPKLYPSAKHEEEVVHLKRDPSGELIRYICIAPASVWFTKQFPTEKWIELIGDLDDPELRIYLVGAGSDKQVCDGIKNAFPGKKMENLAGKLSFLASASLMRDAAMNFTNDSAPLHIASAMNAPVTAFFCSTVPAFGFGPVSERSVIAETNEKLACRPCGLHGKRACPEAHFKCALSIDTKKYSMF